MLLLLDNFEQIVEAAPTVSSLLSETPNTKAAGHEPRAAARRLGAAVPGRAVARRATPSPCSSSAPRPSSPDSGATEPVGEICRRLDGLPLAIELAAARVALLGPDELLDSARRAPAAPDLALARRARAAAHAARDDRVELRPAGAEEQELFRRLAVFSGSFALEAAEVDLRRRPRRARVARATRASSAGWRTGRLRTARHDPRVRGRAARSSRPTAMTVRRRHAEYFLDRRRAGEPQRGDSFAPAASGSTSRMVEHDNIRGALAWAVRSGDDRARAPRSRPRSSSSGSLIDPAEGVRWFERLFERPEAASASPARCAAAQRCARTGSSLHISGDPGAGRAGCTSESLALFDELGDEHGRAVLLHRLGISAML